MLYPYIKEYTVDDNMYYILPKKVQGLDQFELVLNVMMRNRNVDVYVTRSIAKLLSKDIIAEFCGRGDRLHIHKEMF